MKLRDLLGTVPSAPEPQWMFSSARHDWETPAKVFDPLNQEFSFSLDVCALPHNAKCERYFSPADDGLRQRWDGRCWMNPPYGKALQLWVGKAVSEVTNGNAEVVVCLVPVRTDARWWARWIWDHSRHCPREGVEVRFYPRRIRFVGTKQAAPFPAAVVVFRHPDR